MERPAFMDFALQEYNGLDWVTVAWFSYDYQAIPSAKALASRLHPVRVYDSRDGNTRTFQEDSEPQE